jgi:RNA polymerase sigma factor (sigma-70 family)
MPDDRIPGAAAVEAARAGDAQALDALVGAYLPLVYNIVGRALQDPAETDDVVQDVMLQAVRDLRQLRDPDAFRSWLVAITMRQVRGHRRARRSGPARTPLDESELADPGADFVDLTITELGLSDQRREAAEASRWLEGEDRQLLALWWLEAAGQLTRADLVAALDAPAARVAVLVHRTKARLETARAVVRAVRAEPRCPELAAVCERWDGRPSSLWRKRIARHLRQCPACDSANRGLIPAEALLVGLGLVPVPAVLLEFGRTVPGLGVKGGLFRPRTGRPSSSTTVHPTARSAGRHVARGRIALPAAGKAVIATVTVLAVAAVAVTGLRLAGDHRTAAAAVAPTVRATPAAHPSQAPSTPAATPSRTAAAAPSRTADTIVNTAFPVRAAFYYPWYPENFQNNGSHYTPSAGDYSVDDPATVDRQIQDMQYGGLQAGIVSWWGVGLREDKRMPLLMAEAAKLGFSWSVYYEKQGYADPSVAEITSDLIYLRRYSDQRAWLHVDGLPVIFVYAQASDGCGMASRWAQANQTAHYYVVLKVFSGYRACAQQPQGWHQYADTLDIRAGYSAVASPGFWKYDEASPTVPRDPATFRQQVTEVAESREPFQLIVSYNEWGEGTAVESATAWSSASGHGVYVDILHQVFDAYPR